MLTKQRIERAEPREKPYMLPDSDGLYLRIFPSGTKTWVVRRYTGGKAIQKSVGEYPKIGLVEARRLRNRVKDDSSEALDEMTFIELAQKWLTAYSDKLSKSTAYNHRLYLSHVPELHGMKLSQMGRIEIVSALQHVHKERSYKTARRVAVTIGQIFDYALNTGLVKASPAVHLTAALLGTKDERRSKHFASLLSPEDIGRLLRSLDLIKTTTTRLALQFIAYTFPRSGELRNADWSEIDGEVWHIPAAHTKRRKALDVPLSKQALKILHVQRTRTHGIGYIFQADRTGGVMSKSTLLNALKMLRTLPDDIRPGEMTVHGFRAMASTILNESGLWTPDAIERQLSHSPEDDVRAAYNRGEYWGERVRMMQWYADRLDELKAQVSK